MALMASTLYDRYLNPYLLTQNLRHSVYVHPEDNFTLFNFNSDSESLCEAFYKAFRWS